MQRKCVRCGSNGARGGYTRNDSRLQVVRLQEGKGKEKLVVMCFPCASSYYGW